MADLHRDQADVVAEVITLSHCAIRSLQDYVKNDKQVKNASLITSLAERVETSNPVLEQLKASVRSNSKPMSPSLVRAIETAMQNYKVAFKDIQDAVVCAMNPKENKHGVLVESKFSLGFVLGTEGLRTQIRQASSEVQLIYSTQWQTDQVRAEQEVYKSIKDYIGYLKVSNVPGISHCIRPIVEKLDVVAIAEAEKQKALSDSTTTEHNPDKDDDTRSEKTIVQPDDKSTLLDSPNQLDKSAAFVVATGASSPTSPSTTPPSTEPSTQTSISKDSPSEPENPSPETVAWQAHHTPKLFKPSWTFIACPRHTFPPYKVWTEDVLTYMTELDKSAASVLTQHLDRFDLDLLRLDIVYRHRFSPRLLISGQTIKRMVILAEPRKKGGLFGIAEKRGAGAEKKETVAAAQPEESKPEENKGKESTEKDAAPKKEEISNHEKRVLRNKIAKELMAALQKYWANAPVQKQYGSALVDV